MLQINDNNIWKRQQNLSATIHTGSDPMRDNLNTSHSIYSWADFYGSQTKMSLAAKNV